jgi:hypothetical protein
VKTTALIVGLLAIGLAVFSFATGHMLFGVINIALAFVNATTFVRLSRF